MGGWASNTRNVAYGFLTDKGVMTVFKVSHEVSMLETPISDVKTCTGLNANDLVELLPGILPSDSTGKFAIFSPLQCGDSMTMHGIANYVPSATLYLLNY